MNIDIVKLARLACRIFEELAVENLSVLDDMGKSIAAQGGSGLEAAAGVIWRSVEQNGFCGTVEIHAFEFYQYGITREALREMAPSAKSPLLLQRSWRIWLWAESSGVY